MMWVLDADLAAAAFDRVDHDHLLDQLGTFPAREMVRRWLKADVVDRGRFTRSSTQPWTHTQTTSITRWYMFVGARRFYRPKMVDR